MPLRDLIPWSRTGSHLTTRPSTDLLRAMREDMDRLFGRTLSGDGDWLDLWTETEGKFAPRVDVSEDDEAIHVRAELPGMDQEDIDVELSGNRLTLQGERKEEHEETEKHYYRRESSYGCFRRTIPLPAEVQEDQVEAEFKKGVLRVTLPKTAEAKAHQTRIEVKSSAS